MLGATRFRHPGFEWIKASASINTGACVMLAKVGEMVALGDSKRPRAKPFIYSKSELAAFIDGAKQGEFDHLLE
jgi:hypothetical protein